MDYNDFKSLCEARHSTRYFDDTPLAKEEILKLLELGHLAPSIENLQPWHFDIILDKELRHKLAEASCYGNFVEGASVFIVVTANRSYVNAAKDPVWNEKELEYSCMAAMTNILNGATAMGIGSCWVSLRKGKVHEILKLEEHEIVIGGIMLGHYTKDAEQKAAGHERKPLKDVYTIRE